MIYTVFNTVAKDSPRWQAELLEYSWGRVRQPGELVNLVSSTPESQPSKLHHARLVETLDWSPHPYTADIFPAYNTAASLLEWQFTETVDGTILLLEPNSVFRSSISTEATPGHIKATAWGGLPRGEGPFSLGPEYDFLEHFCVNRTLELPPVSFPLLIHTNDLRRFTARWLELTSIIRVETASLPQGPVQDAEKIALVIAMAESSIDVEVADLGITTDAASSSAPVLDYSRPIESNDGKRLWDINSYGAWIRVEPAEANNELEKEFLELLGEYVTRWEAGGALAFLRPCRHKDAREGRILDRAFVDVPGRSDTLSLNASGASIWALCDGVRDLAAIIRAIESQFGLAPGSVNDDVRSVIERLESVGALKLRPI